MRGRVLLGCVGGVGIVGGAGYLATHRTLAPAPPHTPHLVVVGGGVMGSWASYLLAGLGARVTLVDAGHPVRGSWGETRALHLTMEDPLRVEMNLHNAAAYLAMQQADPNSLLVCRQF